jgi:hypothetical protein
MSEVKMSAKIELPAEVDTHILKREEAIFQALKYAREPGPRGSEFWYLLPTAILIAFSAYVATKDPFVAGASAASWLALMLAVSSHRTSRKLHATLAAIVEVVLENERRRT